MPIDSTLSVLDPLNYPETTPHLKAVLPMTNMRTESLEKQSKRLKVSSYLTRGNQATSRLTIFQTGQASSESSVRIRDNQRRSRARRKEYIQDLENRLQKFQAEGVRATREVQEAGRKMAVENSLLRSLLTLHGVSDQRVEEYLKAHTTHTPSSFSDAALSRLQSRHSPRPKPLNNERNVLSPRQTTMAPTSSAPSWIPDTDQQVAMSIDQSQSSEGDSELSVQFDSPAPDLLPLQSSSKHEHYIQSGQCTPCETAAGIISSMRSYPDIQEVRSELGCQSSASCMVKNMDIFQLLNER